MKFLILLDRIDKPFSLRPDPVGLRGYMQTGIESQGKLAPVLCFPISAQS